MITLIDSMIYLTTQKYNTSKFKSLLENISKQKTDKRLLTREDIRNVESSSPIHYYIKRYEPIDDPDEEKELVLRYQKKKDPRAFDRLIRAQSKYMLKLIMNNKSRLEKIDKNISTEEVFNVMIINFAKAINKFNANKNVRFYTYLRHWLNEVITNPSRFLTKSAHEMDKKSSSMDIKLGTGSNGKSISDLIADPNATNMYSDREKEKFMSSFMKRGMRALNSKEQFVIKAFYGLLDSREEDKVKSSKGKVTNAAVAKYLGITDPGVLAIHRRALSKLKSALS